MNGHPISPFDTIICGVGVGGILGIQAMFFCVQTMQLWAPGATYEQKGGSPPKMFQTPKNRQARNHTILLLGSLGTQKTGSGLLLQKKIIRRSPGDPYFSKGDF